MLELFTFPFFLLADDIFDSGYFVVDDILELTTCQEYTSVTSFKVSLLRIAHLCDVVEKFFRCHVLLILIPFPLPHTDLRKPGGAFLRFPLPQCHQRRRV